MRRSRKPFHLSRMLWWLHALSIAGFYLVLWLRTRSQEDRRVSASTATRKDLPRVSIIVPARDEERGICRCVVSLLEQDYPDYELIVVDDGSTDRTPELLEEIARTHARGAKLWILRLRDLPPGWAGKPRALHAGVQEAQGEFLLFTDADTWHAPDALRAAVARAQEKQLDLLSLGTTQELPGFWEKVMMPLAYLGISMQYPVNQVNDPLNPLALANGQYILLRRSVYNQLGGYAREDMRDTLLDDRDLAILVKGQGFRIELADGRDLVHVRMYGSLREIWRGWRKNVFLGSRGGLPFALLQLLGLPMVAVLPFLLPLCLLLTRFTGRGRSLKRGEVLTLSALELGPLLAYRHWIDRELKVPWYYGLTHPLAGGLFTMILAQSTWRVVARRGIDWRGRYYYQQQSDPPKGDA